MQQQQNIALVSLSYTLLYWWDNSSTHTIALWSQLVLENHSEQYWDLMMCLGDIDFVEIFFFLSKEAEM